MTDEGPCIDCGRLTDSLVADWYWCNDCIAQSLKEYELENVD